MCEKAKKLLTKLNNIEQLKTNNKITTIQYIVLLKDLKTEWIESLIAEEVCTEELTHFGNKLLQLHI